MPPGSQRQDITRLVLGLLKPYRGWLAIVLAAMLVEIAHEPRRTLALKLVLDDALGTHHSPAWLQWAHDLGIGRHGSASRCSPASRPWPSRSSAASRPTSTTTTTSIGQWVANDLRLRIYEHLHRLSLAYYDTAKTGTLMSTITSDVATVQSFASSSTLSIVVDIVTIVFMLGLMFWLDWDFTLIAIAVMPFLLLFVFRFKKAVKDVTREVRASAERDRRRGAGRPGLGARDQGLRPPGSRADAHGGRQPRQHRGRAEGAARSSRCCRRWLRCVVALCTGIVLWKGTSLIIAGTMTAGALTVYLAYLSKFFQPVKDLAGMARTIAQTTVALERIQKILGADDIIRERPDAIDPGRARARSVSSTWPSATASEPPVLRDVCFNDRARAGGRHRRADRLRLRPPS